MRSIPACAGAPSVEPSGIRKTTVYPRVCGGTVAGMGNAEELRGLSPRVRGHPQLSRSTDCSIWSIPACAGAPLRRSHLFRLCWVYPRVCGGTCSKSRLALLKIGLSPRVRGHPLESEW